MARIGRTPQPRASRATNSATRQEIVANHSRVIIGGRYRPAVHFPNVRPSTVTIAASRNLDAEGIIQQRPAAAGWVAITANASTYDMNANFNMDRAVERFNSLLIAGDRRALVRCMLTRTAARIYSRLHVNERNSIAVFYLIFNSIVGRVPDFMGIMVGIANMEQLFIRVRLTKRYHDVRTTEILYIALMIADLISRMKEGYGINVEMRWNVTSLRIKQTLFDMGHYSPMINAGPTQQFLDEQWRNTPDPHLRSHYSRLYAWLDEKQMRLTSPNTRLNCFAAAIVCSIRGICFEEASNRERASIKSRSCKLMRRAFNGENDYHLDDLIAGFTAIVPSKRYRIIVMSTGLNVLAVFHEPGKDLEDRYIFISCGHALALVPGKHVIEEEKLSLITRYVQYRPRPKFGSWDVEPETSIPIPEVGFWDMETTTSLTPYMIAVKLEYGAMEVFTGLDCVLRFSHYLFNVPGEEEIVLYAHNGGKFDVPLILNFFRKSPFWVITSFLEHHSRILSMKVRALSKNSRRVIIFRDSYPLMSASLDNLSKLYGVKHPKLAGVNHELMTDDEWMNQIEPQNIETYIRHDVLALQECMTQFRSTTVDQVGFDPFERNVLTSPGISNMVFLERFYNPSMTPLYQLPASVDEFCRKAYNGGRCEVFQRTVVDTEVFYYDIVSLYPFIMSSCDLPYGKPVWVDMPDGLLPDDFFGFLEINVMGGESQFNMIRVKSRDKGLIAPKFIQESVVTIFSEELRFILEHNELFRYRIRCVGGYHFKRGKYLAGVTEMFFEFKRQAKIDGDRVAYSAAKVRLNSIYGKFGIKRYENSVQILGDYQKYNAMLQSGNIIQSDGQFVLARTFQKVKLRHVPTAAAITAYGHMEIMKWILHCSKHGTVYYCDTDSVITDVPPRIINELKPIGSELGDMSMEEEEEILGLVTLSAKLYSYRTQSGDHLTSKGLPTGPYMSKNVIDGKLVCRGYRQAGAAEYLTHDDFIDLLGGQEITLISKRFVGGKRRLLSFEAGLEVTEHTMTISGKYFKGTQGQNGEISQLQGWITETESFFT